MSRTSTVRLHLADDERKAVGDLLSHVTGAYAAADDPAFLLDSEIIASEMPARVRDLANRSRLLETGGFIVGGNPVDDVACGPTPRHWRDGERTSDDSAMEFLTVLYGSLMGSVFGWGTQQEGRLVHDVLPVKEFEGRQLGCAADVFLEMHTEDAFHDMRPDWVVLFCVRNPQDAATVMLFADSLTIPDGVRNVLLEERFTILPDESHRPGEVSHVSSGSDAIVRMQEQPEPIAVLWGNPRTPYLRIDESFWAAADPADTEAQLALDVLAEDVRKNAYEVQLGAGDALVIDNHKCAHGRQPFEPSYNGTDRWLKRVCVTADLRRSRALRADPMSRIVG